MYIQTITDNHKIYTMKIFHGFKDAASIKNPVVTVGSYDGVHLGHREIFKRLNALAEVCDGESVVITLYPHPRKLLGNDGEPLRLLNSMSEKIMLLEQAGVQNLIIADFDEEFSKLSYEKFVKDYLVGNLHMKYLVVGYNHHFGRDKEGSYETLADMAKDLGFEVSQMPAQTMEGGKISSTVIRNLIANGLMERATAQLGAPYFMIAGHKGDLLSSEEECKLLPPEGTYKVTVSNAEGKGKMGTTVHIDAKGKARIDCKKTNIRRLLDENKKILIKFM